MPASGGPFSRETSISAVWPTWSRRRSAINPWRRTPGSADQRRDIGDGAERHVVSIPEDQARAFRRSEATRAQLAIDRNQRHQHETDGGEVAEAR